MTEKDELLLLKAIQNIKSGSPKYKKVYWRFSHFYENSYSEVIDVIKNSFEHEESIDCNKMSIAEWDQINYDLEIRDRFLFMKYKSPLCHKRN